MSRSFWPFGMPNPNNPPVADRQDRENDALRDKHAAENKLTPTKRLRKHVDPDTYHRLRSSAIEKILKIIEEFPEHTLAPIWLNQAKSLPVFDKGKK